MSHSATKGQPTREEKKEEKRRKKAERGPGFFASIKQAHQITRESYPNITLWMVLAGLLTLLVFLGVGFLLHNWLTWFILGIPVGFLVAVLILMQLARRAQYQQIDGQLGASGAVLNSLRGWIVEEQPVQVNGKTQDVVFRAIGRPGVVLVTEGPTQRVKKLVSAEKAHINRVARGVKIFEVNTGHAEGQVKVKDLAAHLRKLPKNITAEEMHSVSNRLNTLGNKSMPIPAGVDPRRARPSHKGPR